MFFKVSYDIKSFKLSPTADFFIAFFTVEATHSMEVTVKDKVGKKLENIFTCSLLFKVVEKK